MKTPQKLWRINTCCLFSQANLEVLDASFNELVTLEGLQSLGQLRELDISWNKLTKVREDTAVLRKHTPALQKLDTRYNPWTKVQSGVKSLMCEVKRSKI